MKIKIDISSRVFNNTYLNDLKDYSKRYQIFYGGAGSGKSQYIAQKLIIKALEDYRKVLVLRKVGSTVKNSVFQLFIDILSEWNILQYCAVNKSNNTIIFPNNSTFTFSGLDDQEKLKSITGITDAWMEETTEFTEDDINQVDLRIRRRSKHLQIYYSFNPVSKLNVCYKRWFDEDALYDKDRTKIIHTTYKDNRFLPQSYIDSIEQFKLTNPAYYKVYALGEFSSTDKLVFYNWKIGIKPEDRILDLLVGLDFGYANSFTAISESYFDVEDRILYVDDEYYERGVTNEEIYNQLVLMQLSKEKIVADSAEPKSIEEIRRLGARRITPAVKGPDSVINGINKLQQIMIVVNPRCTHLIEELNNYSWMKDKKTGEYMNKPVPEYDHLIDSIRYAYSDYSNKNKLQSISKSALGL